MGIPVWKTYSEQAITFLYAFNCYYLFYSKRYYLNMLDSPAQQHYLLFRTDNL